MQKIAGLETVGGGLLAAEAALPPPASLLGAPPGSLTRLLVLDGVQVGLGCVAATLKHLVSRQAAYVQNPLA
jgi:hypothetical protein